MPQIVPSPEQDYPGNKRQPRSRAAQLRWKRAPELELRLAGVEGPAREPGHEVAPPKERAAVLRRLPVWLLGQRLQRDEPWLAGLERVVSGEESTDDLAAHYQRRKSYGWAVVLCLIETAVQRVAAQVAECELSTQQRRNQLRAALVSAMAVVYVDGPVGAEDRRRWRKPAWRESAVETLLAIGADRCLAGGCVTPPAVALGGRPYCWIHRKMEPQHNARIAAVSDLLREVGELLGVPRATSSRSS